MSHSQPYGPCKQPWSLWAIPAPSSHGLPFFCQPGGRRGLSPLKVTKWKLANICRWRQTACRHHVYWSTLTKMNCLWKSLGFFVRLCLLYVLHNFIFDVWAIMSRSAAIKCFSHEQPLCIGLSRLAAVTLYKPANLTKYHGLGVYSPLCLATNAWPPNICARSYLSNRVTMLWHHKAW